MKRKKTLSSQMNVLLALGRYNPKTHRGVARFAGQHNWHLNAEMAYSGHLPSGWSGDGILTLLDTQRDLIEFIRTARVPVVDLSVIREDIAVPRVAGDHYLIGALAAEHFIERGFRHFAWFSVFTDGVARLRLNGFQETLARIGATCDSWFFDSQPDKRRDEWTDKCAFLEHRLKLIPKPAAVFAFCDIDAANVLDACANAGLAVPEEVAILGTDNNELICESVRVPLSSVNHDLEGVGYEGAALLHRLMQGARAPKSLKLIPPKAITVRQSTEVLAVNHEPTRRAIQFLQENYRKRIGAEDVAAICGMSRRKLDQSFHQHVGRSISDQLAALRIIRAKELLLRTDLSAADVAAETGFNTPQYFNNVFSRATGLTPRSFRLKHEI
jgi:LacI family transcriptional regulator, galactose operon repressor